MLDLPLWAWMLAGGVLGVVVGSFLNVVILRLPERMKAEWRLDALDTLGVESEDKPLPPGVVREPSHCPHCLHRLSVLDNIPLFGWLLLRGRCRTARPPFPSSTRWSSCWAAFLARLSYGSSARPGRLSPAWCSPGC